MLYTEEYSPTSAAASIWMLLATGTAKDGELRNLDAEHTFLKVDIDEEIFVEIPGEYEELLEAVRLLSKVIYGLVQAGRCWNNKVYDDMTEIEFEQSTADSCVSASLLTKRWRCWLSCTCTTSFPTLKIKRRWRSSLLSLKGRLH